VAKLSKDEVVTIQILNQKSETNQAIADRLGVTEGAVRYHVRRAKNKAVDGRKKTSLLEQLGLKQVVEHWWKTQESVLPKNRPPNIQELWAFLVDEHQFPGSYKSVRKFARKHFPAPQQRPFRRIETPLAAQTQSDWMEASINIGDDPSDRNVAENGTTKLYGFVLLLSHSRKTAVIWSRSMQQLAYAVPFEYVHKTLEVRGCSGFLQIVDRVTGEVVKQYPRGTQQRLLIDQDCYAGESDSVESPRPLGKISRKLEEFAAEPVQLRSIEMYAQLAEVVR